METKSRKEKKDCGMPPQGEHIPRRISDEEFFALVTPEYAHDWDEYNAVVMEEDLDPVDAFNMYGIFPPAFDIQSVKSEWYKIIDIQADLEKYAEHDKEVDQDQEELEYQEDVYTMMRGSEKCGWHEEQPQEESQITMAESFTHGSDIDITYKPNAKTGYRVLMNEDGTVSLSNLSWWITVLIVSFIKHVNSLPKQRHTLNGRLVFETGKDRSGYVRSVTYADEGPSYTVIYAFGFEFRILPVSGKTLIIIREVKSRAEWRNKIKKLIHLERDFGLKHHTDNSVQLPFELRGIYYALRTLVEINPKR